jgi:hypothetical protein
MLHLLLLFPLLLLYLLLLLLLPLLRYSQLAKLLLHILQGCCELSCINRWLLQLLYDCSF